MLGYKCLEYKCLDLNFFISKYITYNNNNVIYFLTIDYDNNVRICYIIE